jgi:hypothetical protein
MEGRSGVDRFEMFSHPSIRRVMQRSGTIAKNSNQAMEGRSGIDRFEMFPTHRCVASCSDQDDRTITA